MPACHTCNTSDGAEKLLDMTGNIPDGSENGVIATEGFDWWVLFRFNDVGYIIPREGALAWLDCWVITRGARNRALAHAWIDYMLEAGPAEVLSQRHGLSRFSSQSLAITCWLRPSS